ncbi:multi-domain non-ribosomal peptide synthetase [Gluconobacter thailandicus]|uniref:fatty acyl-AMP ligase n=1 Tax=Gluconobacter thailandicus TaxID=257438 RepID=UPI000776F437|nr:fatty acyl-AMP ligase [Gluconobacter thailandicus]KXV35654.1 multi-domain non-ribosomal peptide synthetase [Gluconobacter thailandicus]
MNETFITTHGPDGEDILDWRENTIVDALRFHALRTPDLQLYTLLGDGENETDGTTAAELDQHAKALGSWLRRLLPEGARAILLYDNSLDYIRGLMACLVSGIVPVSGVHPKAFGARDRFLAVRDDSEASAVIGNKSVLAEFQKVCAPPDDGRRFLWIPTDSGRLPSGKQTFSPRSDDIALIQYTSGSTRTPRGVVLTHRNIAHNLFRQAEAFGYRRGDCGVNWLPLSHDMGLIGGALITLGTGGRCVLLAPEHVAEKPVRWLRAISRYRATLSGGPDFMYGLCARTIEDEDQQGLDLSCWEIAFNGAEYIRPDTMQNFHRKFAPVGFDNRSFFSCYGLAEATLLVTASTRGQGVGFQSFSRHSLSQGEATPSKEPLDQRQLASCGAILEDIRIFIANDETDEKLPDGQVGEIRIQSPGVSSGYVNREAENERVFGGGVVGEDGTFLRTGDRGFVRDGELYVVGRQDNRITVGNMILDPEDIIACLTNYADDIRMFSTTVFLESQDQGAPLVIAAELPSGSGTDKTILGQGIGKTVCERFPVQKCRVVFLRAGSMPKTPSGKIRVGEMRERLKSDHVSVLGEEHYTQAGTSQVRILKFAHGKV